MDTEAGGERTGGLIPAGTEPTEQVPAWSGRWVDMKGSSRSEGWANQQGITLGPLPQVPLWRPFNEDGVG